MCKHCPGDKPPKEERPPGEERPLRNNTTTPSAYHTPPCNGNSSAGRVATRQPSLSALARLKLSWTVSEEPGISVQNLVTQAREARVRVLVSLLSERLCCNFELAVCHAKDYVDIRRPMSLRKAQTIDIYLHDIRVLDEQLKTGGIDLLCWFRTRGISVRQDLEWLL